MKTLACSIRDLREFQVSDPEYGDLKLNVFPVNHSDRWIGLPLQFKLWETSVNKILKGIPVQEGATQHYVTIDSKFFAKAETLRREGVHIDGNFCVDPDFKGKTWGGVTWGGSKYHPELTVVKDWDLPYDIEFPVGTYVSERLGGLLCVSSYEGCRAWAGYFEGAVGDEGDCSHLESLFTSDNETQLKANRLYFMTSNTPHESTLIPRGTRRTLLRITLNHNYNNAVLSGEKS